MPSAQRIFINGKFLSQKATGVQKFAVGISLALQKEHPNMVVLVPRGKFSFQGLQVRQSKWCSGFIWEQIGLPLFLLFHKKALLINLCNSAPLLYRNQVVTIHDLAFLKNKQWFSNSFRLWYQFLIPRLCNKSMAILTVSDFIKKEIINRFSILSDKITVVHNGIPLMEYDAQKPYSFKYLLLTGIYNPRKNAALVLSLMPQIKKMGYHIVGVGADSGIFKDAFLKEENHLHLLAYVDDKAYYTLMKHASALVFPSEYEGFGIPVLEALTLETPVIVPDLPVYRESFGELPIYYTAMDADSFLKQLPKIGNEQYQKKDALHLKNKFNFDVSAKMISEILILHKK